MCFDDIAGRAGVFPCNCIRALVICRESHELKIESVSGGIDMPRHGRVPHEACIFCTNLHSRA